MNIYLLSQIDVNMYACYDNCIVIANSIEDARIIHPDSEVTYYKDVDRWFECESDHREYDAECDDGYDTKWCRSPSQVIVEYLGQYKDNVSAGKIICANYQ